MSFDCVLHCNFAKSATPGKKNVNAFLQIKCTRFHTK